MSAFGWILFAACLVAAGCLGGTIRGAYDDWQAERESAQRSAEGAHINLTSSSADEDGQQ